MEMKRVLYSAILVLSHFVAQGQSALDFSFQDYVTATQCGPTDSAARTVEIWGKNCGGNLVKWGTNSSNNFCALYMKNNRLELSLGSLKVTSSQIITDTAWHHYAATYHRDSLPQIKLYIDGQQAASHVLSGPINTSITGLSIGGSGIIDELRIWNLARSASEIAGARQMRFCQQPQGLIHRYAFNEGVPNGLNTNDTIAYDSVGTNHATLYNFSLDGSSGNWVPGIPINNPQIKYGQEQVTACNQYVSPSGKYLWNQTGVFLDTVILPTGCDSIITIDLTIHQSDTVNLVATGCNQFRLPKGSQIWYSSGVYQEQFTNLFGCDSIVELNLTMNYVDTSVLINSNSLTSWQGFAKYQWYECSNGFVEMVGDTNQTFYMPGNGSYAVEINKDGCIDTSACYFIPNVSVDEPDLKKAISIFPNPSAGTFNVDLPEQLDEVKWKIVDTRGSVLMIGSAIGSFILDTSLSPGSYVLMLYTNDFVICKHVNVHK
jgi:hypothetical protein